MFNKKKIEAWQGETVDLSVTAPDATYQMATLLVGNPGEAAVFTYPVAFTDLEADLTITDEANTIPVGAYKYMVKVDYTDGSVKYFPDPNKCASDDLPDFIVKARINEA